MPAACAEVAHAAARVLIGGRSIVRSDVWHLSIRCGRGHDTRTGAPPRPTSMPGEVLCRWRGCTVRVRRDETFVAPRPESLVQAIPEVDSPGHSAITTGACRAVTSDLAYLQRSPRTVGGPI